jgi:uncharacterized RDD family membrane protein YckC
VGAESTESFRPQAVQPMLQKVKRHGGSDHAAGPGQVDEMCTCMTIWLLTIQAFFLFCPEPFLYPQTYAFEK